MVSSQNMNLLYCFDWFRSIFLFELWILSLDRHSYVCMWLYMYTCTTHTQKDQLSLQRISRNGGRVRISADDGLPVDGTTTDDGSDYSGSSATSYVESLHGPEESFIIWFVQLLTTSEKRCLKSTGQPVCRAYLVRTKAYVDYYLLGLNV